MDSIFNFLFLTGSTGLMARVKYAAPQRNKSNKDFTGQAGFTGSDGSFFACGEKKRMN